MSVVTPIATLLFGAAKRRLGPISDIGPLIRSPGRRAEEAANVGTLMPIMRPRGLCQLQFECECTWGIRTSAIHTQGGQALCQKAASLFCTWGQFGGSIESECSVAGSYLVISTPIQAGARPLSATDAWQKPLSVMK